MRDSWLQSYERLKKIFRPRRNLNLKATATQTPPPGSFVHQNSQLCFICAGVLGRYAPRPALIPGDHQVIAFLAPCLVGFTFDLATDLSHPLKPNQIVVLLVVK